ncbi:MAG TPA: L-threonylcarbamoyladenylate synthase [Candidatus Saccharimonadales bacterium]|nr:L-threonylcarbamoyladenylate synthase [Candidatus Saccharimonadales bacterium]
MKPSQVDYERALAPLAAGQLVVIPTDTIYGVVCSARLPEAVERLYAARQRGPEAPCIILIGSSGQLASFGIEVSAAMQAQLDIYWPGPTSIVLPSADPKWKYLRRGQYTLAFRLPNYPALRSLLLAAGPLLAPSANPAGQPPATTIDQARRYFGGAVDTYIDGGTLDNSPSQLIALDPAGHTITLRP